jgi:hypothetical protein
LPDLSLREYLLDSFAQRSFKGWRDVHPTWREVVAVTIFLVFLGYALWIAYWSGIENHCLWDHYGSRCQSGGSH